MVAEEGERPFTNYWRHVWVKECFGRPDDNSDSKVDMSERGGFGAHRWCRAKRIQRKPIAG
jgi:hypothetical protein